MNKLFSFVIFVFLLLIFSSFSANLTKKATPRQSQSDQVKWPSSQDLRRKARELRKMLLVYGTGNSSAVSDYRYYALKYAHEFNWIEIKVKPDTSVRADELTSLPCLLIGTPSSNRILKKTLNSLPFDFEQQTFEIKDILDSKKEDVLVLSNYPNPLNPTLPISIISGNLDKNIVEFLPSLGSYFVRASEFRVIRNGQGIVFGFFEQQNHGPWRIDLHRTRTYLAQAPVLKTKHYVYRYHGKHLPQKEIEQFAQQQERRIQKLLQALHLTFGNSSPFPPIEFHLYERAEDKGLITGNTDLSHFDLQRWQVHALYNEYLQGDDFYADARLLIAKYVGDSKSLALRDGFAMFFSEGWRKKGYRYWAKFIDKTGNALSLSELLDNGIYRRESYLFTQPLAGTFVGFMIEKYGFQQFLELYKSWPEQSLPKQDLPEFSIAKLEQGWRNFLNKLPEAPEKTDRNQLSRQPVFQKGFCFAHEGYQIYNGYLSEQALESLQKLRALGTDWISITPFGYLQDPNTPSYFRYSFGAGSENDESLLTAFYFAKSLGMGVMLKPHVLMSGGDWGWPGEVQMQSEKDWQAFFDYYYRWIRHYAMLAEMYHIDLLCIGVELLHATRDHNKEWRELITKIRRIYHGPLVYGANWWQEFEHVTFWDALDYIGLNCYMPLSQKERVTMADLRQGARKMLPIIEKVAQRYNKPVLLTEVGFTSTAKPWQNPHERLRDVPADPEDQARCYEAMFDTFWKQDWFYGFYWWKWPTYLEYGGPNHNGFTPNGKAAEKVVEKWYSVRAKHSKHDFF